MVMCQDFQEFFHLLLRLPDFREPLFGNELDVGPVPVQDVGQQFVLGRKITVHGGLRRLDPACQFAKGKTLEACFVNQLDGISDNRLSDLRMFGIFQKKIFVSCKF